MVCCACFSDFHLCSPLSCVHDQIGILETLLSVVERSVVLSGGWYPPMVLRPF